jgi:DNA helicase-2/ATP-dependent DNA helicase PcrA
MWGDGLNPEQLAVAEHGREPLVVQAGAGTGKTRALTARVCQLLERGVPPERILLLTFTRRAADEMLARATRLAAAGSNRTPWGGTFHSVAYRLLRANAEAFGLGDISVLDPADAASVVELLREHFDMNGVTARQPRSPTLVEAISRSINMGKPLRQVLDEHYPWCVPHADNIVGLAQAFVARKRERGLLDFDDLLLAWRAMLNDPVLGESIRSLWDYVLVDEYQDVNRLQVDIVTALRPNGDGLTVVGDDAQAIYGFRGSDPGYL